MLVFVRSIVRHYVSFTGSNLLYQLEKSLQVRKVVVSSSAIVQSFCRTDEKPLRVHHVEIYGVLPAFME